MALAYHPHHKPNLKNHIANKWKPHITTKHIPQDNSHTCLLTRFNTHQNHKPYPRTHPYSILNFHTKQKLHPTPKIPTPPKKYNGLGLPASPHK